MLGKNFHCEENWDIFALCLSTSKIFNFKTDVPRAFALTGVRIMGAHNKKGKRRSDPRAKCVERARRSILIRPYSDLRLFCFKR